MTREMTRSAHHSSPIGCEEDSIDWRTAHEWLSRLAAMPNVANAEDAADEIICRLLSQLGYAAIAKAWSRVHKDPDTP